MKNHKGKLNPMYGKIPSLETRAKIGNANRGTFRSEETKAKMSEAHKGKTLSDETKAKLSAGQIGNLHWNYGNSLPEEVKAKISKALKGRMFSEEHRARLSATNKGRQTMLGHHHTPETKAKMRKVWLNPNFKKEAVRNIILGCLVCPNKLEKTLLALLDSIVPNEWSFVGDGQLIIAGKNPDFANINGRKLLIELYGDYWHRGENPQKRIDLFRQYGYDTLVIWENELDNPKEVSARITEFATRTGPRNS